MIDACDPGVDIKTLSKLIRMNTGENLKLTREEICQVYDDIKGGKLPLPPLVMNSTRTYLIDKKSPLTVKDYEQYFNSSTKKGVLKRFAKKVGLKNIDALTKQDLSDAIGARLMYMKVREPVKIGRRRSCVKRERLALPVNNLRNNGPTNNVGAVNNGPTNNGPTNNMGPTNNNGPMNNVGAVNNGPMNNGPMNNGPMNNGPMNNGPTNNVGAVNNSSLSKNQPNSKISIPKGSLFKKEKPPAFIRNYKPGSRVKFNNVFENKKPGFFAGIFGKKKSQSVPNRRNNVGPVVPNRRNNVKPEPITPNRRNNVGPVVPNRRNNVKPEPITPNRRNNVGPVVPNRRNNVKPEPITPNRRNNVKPEPITPNRPDISSVKAKFRSDLQSLKKLKPLEVNMFLARVRTSNNLNKIFDNARAMNQKRYEQEVQNAEAKARGAKTKEERKAAKIEQLRIEKEQEAARIKAQKNAVRLENEERRMEIAKRERAIKNAKTAFSDDLATLKKLSKSERTSYLSQIRTIDNINSVFEKARAVDQQRYDQELANTEAKVQRAKTEQERKLAQTEQRRIEKEQQNAERSAEKKAKALQNQELRTKQGELKLEEQKRRANIQAEEKALQNTTKSQERKRRTNIRSRETAFKNAKNSLKRSLTGLKLTPQQRNGLVARVKTIENIDDIFEEGRTLSRQRFNQNLANAEAKKQKAKTEKERKEAEAEQRRLVKEQENTKILAQKNAMRMRNLERKIENETRKNKFENVMRQASVNRVYLNKYAIGKNIDTLNVNALKQKVLKDRELAQLVANLEGKTPILKYVSNSNYQRLYDNTKRKLEEKKKRGVTNTIEKNLLSIPDVDQVYLKAYAGTTPVNQVNKQALTNKIAKDRKVRNMLEKAKPSTFGKRKVVFIRPENYNTELEKVQSALNAKNTERLDKNALIRLTTNAAVSANYVKAFAAGKPLVNIRLNTLKQKRDADLNVAKLNATDVKTIFGKYKTMVPNTRKLKYIDPGQYNIQKRKAEENLEKRRTAMKPNKPDEPDVKVNPLNRFLKTVGTIKKDGANTGQGKEAVSNTLTTTTTTNVKVNRFKKAVNKVKVVETLKKPDTTEKRKKLLNKISKYTNKRITVLKGRAGNPFRTAQEYNQINAEVNRMIKLVEDEANTKKKVREGVEFKLKQIKGLTTADVAEFMKKWNTSKNKTIFNKARKRGAGRLAGKEKTKERAKPKEENNFNAPAAINQLKKANAAAKIQAAFRGKKGRNAARRVKLNKAPTNPLFQNNTGEISAAALAPKSRENVNKFNRQSATSIVNRLKKLSQTEKIVYKGKIARAGTKSEIRNIQESAVRVNARKKYQEDREKEKERKKRADAEAERVRKMKAKKATREAAERAAESAKKMLTETEKMKAKAKENKKFNNKLAEKRRLLREREAKLGPKKRKPKKKQ